MDADLRNLFCKKPVVVKTLRTGFRRQEGDNMITRTWNVRRYARTLDDYVDAQEVETEAQVNDIRTLFSCFQLLSNI